MRSLVNHHMLGRLTPLVATCLIAACGGSTEGGQSGAEALSASGGTTSSVDALVARAISATPRFAPEVPLLVPENLQVAGLFVTVKNDNGRVVGDADVPGDGWEMDFTTTANCNVTSCFVFSVSGSHTVLSATSPGDEPLANGLFGTYDAPGCSACGEGVLEWRVQGSTPGTDYSFQMAALNRKRSKAEMVAIANSAIQRGLTSPAGLLISQAVAATPNFKPDVPVVFPSSLAVGGLTAVVQNENGKVTGDTNVPGDGWFIAFVTKPQCNEASCFMFEITGMHTVLSAVDPGDVPLANGIFGSYQGPGCDACGEGGVDWRVQGQAANADYSYEIKSDNVKISEAEMIALATDAVIAGPRQLR